MNNKLIIAGILVVGLGIGGYFWYQKSKKKDSSEKKPETKDAESISDNLGTNKPKSETEQKTDVKIENPTEGLPTAELKGETRSEMDSKKCSPERRLKGDKKWKYKKCDGVWFTQKIQPPPPPNVKRSAPNWISLAKNTKATDLLNKAFPND